MPRTRKQLEQAAADAEAWLDSLDPEVTPAEDISDLAAIGAALAKVAAAEGEIEVAVAAARANGRSWPRIALVLGISKQAAQQRYGAAEVAPADPRQQLSAFGRDRAATRRASTASSPARGRNRARPS
ncbi:MAG: sigma-70 family RNA polymerase sigma factor [Actinomycetota bacterium]|nr:sigma-70 family RNA polymerase sigma factor [Acidimicrobiia bacterium]MDQ3292833.1 sigma-70 family RNA polymerase sigma factor [Actinomycetota bacterium]